MGNGGLLSAKQSRLPIEDVVALMMPVYYTHNADITEEVLATARDSWLMIVEDRSPAFLKKKNDPTSDVTSGMSWFYALFYDRLFDVHPMSKPLFRNGMKSQGKFLVRMISTTLNSLKNPEKFTTTIEELALRHCERGVKACEYSIVGDVLFWTLEKSLGKMYTPQVEDSWKKIYSAMIQIIIPLALKHERSGVVEREVGSERHTLRTRSGSFRRLLSLESCADDNDEVVDVVNDNLATEDETPTCTFESATT